MMEKLVVDEVALDEWKQAYDAASVCWKKTPMIYSMSVGMFSMKRAMGLAIIYLPLPLLLLLKLLMPLIVLPYGIVLSVLLGLVGKLIKTCILNGLL